jgi:hypothetical protein
VRLGVLLCAAIFLAYGSLVWAEAGAAAGPSAEQTAQAADGPVSASGEVAAIFIEQPSDTTLLYLQGASGLEFRLAGDLSRAYGPGDFVRIDGIKTGAEIHAQAIRAAPSPSAAAAPTVAIGAVFAALVGADLLTPRAAGRKMPWQGLAARLRAARSASARARDDEAVLEDR